MSVPLINLVEPSDSSHLFQNSMSTNSHISSNKTNTGFRIGRVPSSANLKPPGA